METKHTPGPWSVRHQPYRDGFKFAVCGEDFWPAAIFSDGRSNAGTAEANAALIAAAPEMLDALRGLVNCHTGAVWQTAEAQRRWWLAAAAAISKAEGRA